MLSYCDALAITELTTIEEFLESNLGMRLVEDIARTLHLEKEEAVEFTRFVFDDVAKALAKRNIPNKNKDSADKDAFIDGVKLRGEPY